MSSSSAVIAPRGTCPAALRDRRPRERYFGAEVLRLFNLFDYSDEAPFDAPLVDLSCRGPRANRIRACCGP